MPHRSHPPSHTLQLERCASPREDNQTTNAYDDELPIVIAMLHDGRLKAEPLVSQAFPLKDAWNRLTCFEEAGRANIKMLIEMDA
ncbi:MAG: hypothetical protein ABSC65_23910 [Acidobacteriaceae bacterium]|jgi:threonine dehydrogenase-like Zn-dependent dehydrogenase